MLSRPSRRPSGQGSVSSADLSDVEAESEAESERKFLAGKFDSVSARQFRARTHLGIGKRRMSGRGGLVENFPESDNILVVF